jgi:elongation factor G
MEKFFEEEPFTEEEINGAIKTALAQRDLMPVICGANDSTYGAKVLLDTMVI